MNKNAHRNNPHMKGVIVCRQCGSKFRAHVSTKYCSDGCKLKYVEANGKKPKKEDRETKRIRRKAYREKSKALGTCRYCSKAVASSGRCEYHRKIDKSLDRIRKAKKCYGPLWEKQVELLTIKDQIKEIENVAIKLISQKPEGHPMGDSGGIKIWHDTRE